MKKTTAARVGVCLVLLLSVAVAARRQDLPRATPDHGGFGLPDLSGGRFILLADLARPELLKTALCSGGRRLAVQFERRQPGRPNDGRQHSSNFDTLAGSVFTVQGRARANDPCFLASDTFLQGMVFLTGGPSARPAACTQREEMAALRNGRAVKNCWPLVLPAVGPNVALVEFERVGKDALASVVLIDGSRTRFADHPAEFRGEGQDLWRADDGGVLSPRGFRVVFALRRGSEYALAIAWQGAEGQSLSFWTSSSSTDRLTKVVADYWYQAPT